MTEDADAEQRSVRAMPDTVWHDYTVESVIVRIHREAEYAEVGRCTIRSATTTDRTYTR